MNIYSRLAWAVGAFLVLAPLSHAQQRAPDIEILTRGPVHEAFAQANDPRPGPGPVAPREPPPPIVEMPPAEGAAPNTSWIDGYWSWDGERGDFIWVSGAFRKAPPGRQFVPGHWVDTPQGWRWVEGFWAPDSQTDIPYVQEPPAPLETAPSIAPPDDNSAYVQGYWANNGGTFAWRPGFYTPFRAGRVWNSPRYIWTPAGYIFVGGYWDYPIEDRGQLFAPVWFNRPLWQTAGWRYQPDHLVILDAMVDSLFWRNGSYYFGNYYGAGYGRLGYRPWFALGYDPLFNYYRWNHRGSNWAAGRQNVFHDRVAGRAAAPPLTIAHQTAGNRIVMPLSQVARAQTPNTRITAASSPVSNSRAQQLSQSRAQIEGGQRSVGGIAPAAHTASPRLVAPSAPTVTPAAVPRVLNNTTAAPRVVATAAPRPVSPAAVRSGSPPAARPVSPARTFAPAPQQHFAAHVTTGGRSVNHAPARSSGSAHHGRH